MRYAYIRCIMLMCQKTRIRLQMGFCLSLGDSQRLHAVRIFLLYQLNYIVIICHVVFLVEL